MKNNYSGNKNYFFYYLLIQFIKFIYYNKDIHFITIVLNFPYFIY